MCKFSTTDSASQSCADIKIIDGDVRAVYSYGNTVYVGTMFGFG